MLDALASRDRRQADGAALRHVVLEFGEWSRQAAVLRVALFALEVGGEEGALESGGGGVEVGGRVAEHLEFACSAEFDEFGEYLVSVRDVCEECVRVLVRLEHDADGLVVVEEPVVLEYTLFTFGDLQGFGGYLLELGQIGAGDIRELGVDLNCFHDRRPTSLVDIASELG